VKYAIIHTAVTVVASLLSPLLVALAGAAGSESIQALLDASDRHPVVAVSEVHRLEQDKAFLLSLIRDPGFSRRVKDIAVEFGNAHYQKALDRYIAGNSLPMAELRKIWRDTRVVNGLWEAPIYGQFLAAVREVNQKLPKRRRARVLACAPPINWSRVQSLEDAKTFLDRDSTCAAILERESLSKNRRVLLVMGDAHVSRRNFYGKAPDNVVNQIESRRPGSVFVVHTYFGHLKSSREIEQHVVSSGNKVPNLISLKDAWFGGLEYTPPRPVTRTRVGGGQAVSEQVTFPSPPHLRDVADALLFLGPKQLLTRSRPSPGAFDPEYLSELERRHQLLLGAALDRKQLYD